MLNYVCMGTNDRERAAAFYDAVFGELGAKRTFETPRGVFWGTGKGPMIGVILPFDGEQATRGNGDMPALRASDDATVDRVYNRAIELGATCEGPPSSRFPGFYAAYFRDKDGNKLAVTHITQIH